MHTVWYYMYLVVRVGILECFICLSDKLSQQLSLISPILSRVFDVDVDPIGKALLDFL